VIGWLLMSLAAAAEVAPAGVWDLEGRDLTRETYEGSLLVQPWGPAFDLTWHTSIGDYQGVGVLLDDHLYAAWGSGTDFGVLVYQVGDGELRGDWFTWRERGAPGEERATPRGRIRRGLIGTWEVDGRAPGGSTHTYRSLLTVEKHGRTWVLTWEGEGSRYRGVGVRRGDQLIVGWAHDGDAGLADYRIRDGTARGRWAIAGQRRRGREDLVRR